MSDTKQVGEISPKELTITYVCSHYPRKLFGHLERKRRLAVTKKQTPYYEALMDLIVRANWEEMEEARKMCNALRELCEDMYKDVLEEKEKAALKYGLKQGMERGEYRTKKIFKLFATGTPIELIAKQCDVSVEKVQQILE